MIETGMIKPTDRNYKERRSKLTEDIDKKYDAAIHPFREYGVGDR